MKTKKKYAEEFINRYPNMFSEDKWFWVEEIEKLILQVKEMNLKNQPE